MACTNVFSRMFASKMFASKVIVLCFVVSIVAYHEQTLAQQNEINEINEINKVKLKSTVTGNNVANRLSAADNTALFNHEGLKPNHVKGARIYDDFTVELGYVPTEANDLLLLATPTDPTMPMPSLTEGWRCSYCHGYDYVGGRYTFPNDATPNLLESREIRKIDEEFVYNIIKNGFNVYDGIGHINVHNYSGKMDIQDMVNVADFVANEIYDARQYIRDTSNESVWNHMPSMFVYQGAKDLVLEPNPLAVRVNGQNFTCTECHGVDGRLVPGIDLYAMAWTDPYKWMHRVNFGTPRSILSYPNITQEDGTIHPGVYEVMLIKGLHFGGSRQTAELLEYVQTHFSPVAP